MSLDEFLSTLPAVLTDEVTVGEFTLRQYRAPVGGEAGDVIRESWVRHAKKLKELGFTLVNTEVGAVINRDVITRTTNEGTLTAHDHADILDLLPHLVWEEDGWRTDARRGYVHVQSTRIPDGVLGNVIWRLWRTHKFDLEVDGYLVKREDEQWFLKRLIPATSPLAPESTSTLEESRATDAANGTITVPEGLTLLPFQRAGIHYAIKRPRVLFADEMGLGKTVQAIMTFATTKAFPVIVVAPASLKVNWAREIKRWVPNATPIILDAKPNESTLAALTERHHDRIPPKTLMKHFSIGAPHERLTTQNATEALTEALDAPERVLIVNYDILEAWLPFLTSEDAGCVCFDEFHYVKESSARRSKAARALAKNIKKVIGMTGTPILNRPKELLAQLEVLGVVKELFGSNWHYLQRYTAAVKTDFGWDFTGHANLTELQTILRSNIMVRRLKRDVLTELPPKRRQLISLQPTKATKKLLAEEIDVHEYRERKLAEHKHAMKLALANGDDIAYQTAVQELREEQQATFAVLAKLRQEIGLAKVPLVIDYIDTALEAEQKIVVFAHHREVIRRIREAFPDVTVGIDGSMPLAARQDAVDAFQTNPNVRLFVGNLVAAGVGITLTAAAHVIFAESDWVPGILTQAEDRCHRVGQRDSVLVTHMLWDGSLDARMAKVVLEKQRVADTALDATPAPQTTEGTDFNEFDGSWLTDTADAASTPAPAPATARTSPHPPTASPPQPQNTTPQPTPHTPTARPRNTQPPLFTPPQPPPRAPTRTEAFELTKRLHLHRRTLLDAAATITHEETQRHLITTAEQRIWDTDTATRITTAFAALDAPPTTRESASDPNDKQVAKAK